MLAATQLYGVREDVVGALSIVMGPTKANQFFTSFETLIEQKATSGAKDAIPAIRAEVRTEARAAVKPWIIGVGVVSGVALVGATWALVRTRR